MVQIFTVAVLIWSFCRKRKANYENYTCTPKPTPAPVVEPSGDGSGDSGSGDGSGNGWPTGLTENENGNTFIPGK